MINLLSKVHNSATFLNDYFFVNEKILHDFICALRDIREDFLPTCSLLLSEEHCFFFHKDQLMKLLDEDCRDRYCQLRFVDVSTSVGRPKVDAIWGRCTVN